MAATNAISLTASPSVAHGTNGLRDIRPPVEIPSGWVWLWWALAGLALAVALVALWLWWQKKRRQQPPIVIVPPHERARKRLQEALALIDQAKPFCILVSDTLRVYLEERFDLHAPERTTEEFLRELQGSRSLQPDQKESLADFLTQCDLVKFARHEPGRRELEALHASAIRLIDESEPMPAEVSEPVTATA